MKLSNNLENKVPSEIYRKVQLIGNNGSSLPFFTKTTGIQTKLDVFEESRSVITILTNFLVTEISYIFRLVLQEKAGN